MELRFAKLSALLQPRCSTAQRRRHDPRGGFLEGSWSAARRGCL